MAPGCTYGLRRVGGAGGPDLIANSPAGGLGAQQNRWGYRNAKRLGGLEVPYLTSIE
jgi:hypothetical protein